MSQEPTESSGEQVAASLLTLPLHFEVVFDKEADRKYVRLVYGRALKHALAMFWTRNSLGYAGLMLGIYGSLSSGMVMTACMIVTVGGWLYKQHRVVATELAESKLTITDPKRVSVSITEEGVVEILGDLETRFAWSAMQQWVLSEDILYIQLTNGAWAWLPARGMAPTLRLEDLASLLASKGVLERKLQPEAANNRS